MRHFIHRENIMHFRSLLETESDPAKRDTILKLLAGEEVKEADALPSPSSQARAI